MRNPSETTVIRKMGVGAHNGENGGKKIQTFAHGEMFAKFGQKVIRNNLFSIALDMYTLLK